MRIRCCHPGTFQVFSNRMEGIWWREKSSSSLGCALSYPEIPVYRMKSTVGTEHLEGFRGFSLGTGDTLMAQAFKIVIDQGLLAMRGLCAARRVSPRMRFASQIGTLVILPEEDGSEMSTMASTLREHAQYGLRGDRIGEADHPRLGDGGACAGIFCRWGCCLTR